MNLILKFALQSAYEKQIISIKCFRIVFQVSSIPYTALSDKQ